jgi:hypothetical protein
MSTSPSLTVNWNFDTPENHAAWDAITRPSSYFAPTVTYGENNNVDGATTYNDCRRGRRSPGIDSNDLGDTTTLRDLEDAKAYFPDPPQHDSAPTVQVDPPFWKTVADDWADDFLFKAYVKQEKKRALLAALTPVSPQDTPLTQTPPSSSGVKMKTTTTFRVGDATTPSPTATAAPSCSPHALTSIKKTMKKPKFPQPKQRIRKIGRWRYVSVKEEGQRQTAEEEFRCIAEGCTHLGPGSARCAIPYPPLSRASSTTAGSTTSRSAFPRPTDEVLHQPSGFDCVWG